MSVRYASIVAYSHLATHNPDALSLGTLEKQFQRLQRAGQWPILRQWWLAHKAAKVVINEPSAVRHMARHLFITLRRAIAA